MDKINGRIKEMHFWRESTDSKDSAKFSREGSVKSLCFPGLEKQPRVLLQRIDIEPYLQRRCKAKMLRGNIPQLVSNCFVKLAREDMEVLQKEIRENIRLNNLKTKGILKMRILHCKVCEKAYNSEKKLQNHLENKHLLVYKAELAPKTQKKVSFSDFVLVHKLQQYHRCRQCTKLFEKYQSLKAHMKQQHRKRKCYICNYCSKNFVDRMFFKDHIKQHCDVCGLLLPNKAEYLQHRQESCRVNKTYRCKTCERTFFSYMDLKEHSYEHLERTHVCDICLGQYRSKCAVAIHIMFLHSRKLKELFTSKIIGNECLYVCNFCHVSSSDRDVMDRHVSMLPDTTKDYSCDQCQRRFATETSMVQHKWSHFLNIRPQAQPTTPVKRRFKTTGKLPRLKQPRIVLDRLDLTKLSCINIDSNNSNSEDKNETKNVESVDTRKANDSKSKDDVVNAMIDSNQTEADISVQTDIEMSQEVSPVEDILDFSANDEVPVIVKKALVDPNSNTTMISKYQCDKCHEYYSNNYALNSHKAQAHMIYESLQCHICEQTFLWPSLLDAHKCMIPKTQLDNRSEFQYENYREFGSDELMNISENEDCMNGVDFEIPMPPVQLTECNSGIIGNESCVNVDNYGLPVNSSYKLVMQEVPIEF